MPTHLYCLARSADARVAPPAGLTGIVGTPVRSIDVDAFSAWVGDVPHDRLPSAVASLTDLVSAHDAVVGAAVERASVVIPALLTQPLGTDDAWPAAIRASNDIEALAAIVANRVEMTVVVDGRRPSKPVIAATTGREYLEKLRGETGSIDALNEACAVIWQVVERFSVDERTRGSVDSGRVAMSHLIATEDVIAYRGAVSDTSLPTGVRAVLDGPRAAYSFAALSLGSDSGI